MPFLAFTISHIAIIHFDNLIGESSKIVPTLTENCFLHSLFLHCQTFRDSINVLLSLSHRGQIALPSFQRREAINLTQNNSSEKKLVASNKVCGKLLSLYYPQKENRKGAGLSRSKYSYNASNTGRRAFMSNFTMKHSEHNGNNPLRFPSSIQKFNCETGLHPTQKPVKLMQYLVKTYTQKGETVLDFTMGSGTTGVACMIENRKFLGIEKDTEYFAIAEARIKRANLEPVDIPQRQTIRAENPAQAKLF